MPTHPIVRFFNIIGWCMKKRFLCRWRGFLLKRVKLILLKLCVSFLYSQDYFEMDSGKSVLFWKRRINASIKDVEEIEIVPLILLEFLRNKDFVLYRHVSYLL